MAADTWPFQAAKSGFGEVVDAARQASQSVTKDGKPVVVLAAGEYKRLHRLERVRAPSFVEMLLAMPQGSVEFERLETPLRDPAF
jgi:antitoxin Phd